MCEILAANFYKKLYNESNTEKILDNVFINNLDIRLGEHSKNELEQEMNEEEIKEAIDKMKKAKVPGIDGIPVEFYSWGWKIVKRQFVEVLQYVQKTEDVHDKFLDGLIAVVHKKGDTNEIKNYRPLTLLNVDYKIYAKVIANRLMSKAQEIFNETQYALRGRSIFDLMTYI